MQNLNNIVKQPIDRTDSCQSQGNAKNSGKQIQKSVKFSDLQSRDKPINENYDNTINQHEEQKVEINTNNHIQNSLEILDLSLVKNMNKKSLSLSQQKISANPPSNINNKQTTVAAQNQGLDSQQFIEIENRWDNEFLMRIPEHYLFKSKKGSKSRRKLDLILNQVQCRICQGIVNLRTGHSCSNCNSKLCQQCYQDFQWSELSKKLKTPCCTNGQISAIKRSPIQTKDCYKILKFKCKIRGCESFLAYDEFVDPTQHNDCRRKKYQCTYCNTVIESQSKLSHQIKCNLKPIECDYCHKLCNPNDMEFHLISGCQQAQKQREKGNILSGYNQNSNPPYQIQVQASNQNDVKSNLTSTFGQMPIGNNSNNRNLDSLIGSGRKYESLKSPQNKNIFPKESAEDRLDHILGKRPSLMSRLELSIKHKMCSICQQMPKQDNCDFCSNCAMFIQNSNNTSEKKRDKKLQNKKSGSDISKFVAEIREKNENEELKEKIRDLEDIVRQKEMMLNSNKRVIQMQNAKPQGGNPTQQTLHDPSLNTITQIEISSNMLCYFCSGQNKNFHQNNRFISFCKKCILSIMKNQLLLESEQNQNLSSILGIKCADQCKQNLKAKFYCKCFREKHCKIRKQKRSKNTKLNQLEQNLNSEPIEIQIHSDNSSIIDVTEQLNIRLSDITDDQEMINYENIAPTKKLSPFKIQIKNMFDQNYSSPQDETTRRLSQRIQNSIQLKKKNRTSEQDKDQQSLGQSNSSSSINKVLDFNIAQGKSSISKYNSRQQKTLKESISKLNSLQALRNQLDENQQIYENSDEEQMVVNKRQKLTQNQIQSQLPVYIHKAKQDQRQEFNEKQFNLKNDQEIIACSIDEPIREIQMIQARNYKTLQEQQKIKVQSDNCINLSSQITISEPYSTSNNNQNQLLPSQPEQQQQSQVSVNSEISQNQADQEQLQEWQNGKLNIDSMDIIQKRSFVSPLNQHQKMKSVIEQNQLVQQVICSSLILDRAEGDQIDVLESQKSKSPDFKLNITSDTGYNQSSQQQIPNQNTIEQLAQNPQEQEDNQQISDSQEDQIEALRDQLTNSIII
eukprot:403354770